MALIGAPVLYSGETCKPVAAASVERSCPCVSILAVVVQRTTVADVEYQAPSAKQDVKDA